MDAPKRLPRELVALSAPVESKQDSEITLRVVASESEAIEYEIPVVLCSDTAKPGLVVGLPYLNCKSRYDVLSQSQLIQLVSHQGCLGTRRVESRWAIPEMQGLLDAESFVPRHADLSAKWVVMLDPGEASPFFFGLEGLVDLLGSIRALVAPGHTYSEHVLFDDTATSSLGELVDWLQQEIGPEAELSRPGRPMPCEEVVAIQELIRNFPYPDELDRNVYRLERWSASACRASLGWGW